MKSFVSSTLIIVLIGLLLVIFCISVQIVEKAWVEFIMSKQKYTLVGECLLALSILSLVYHTRIVY